MWCLKGKMKIYDKLMIGLLKHVGLDYRIFQLLLKDQIFLFQSLESIETAIWFKLSQKNFSESTWSKCINNGKSWKIDFICSDFVKFRSELLFLCLYRSFSLGDILWFSLVTGLNFSCVADGLFLFVGNIRILHRNSLVLLAYMNFAADVLILFESLPLSTLLRWVAIPVSESQVKYILLYFFYNFLQLTRFILYDKLVLLYLGN